MSGSLPALIDPIQLAQAGARLRGHLPVGCMPRLSELLVDTHGDVAVDIESGRDMSGVSFMDLTVAAALTLRCQRCLEAMRYPVSRRQRLGLVTSQAAAERLPDEFEPLIVTAEPMSLSDIVEDELILALPIVAAHDQNQACSGRAVLRAAAQPVTEERGNPFDVLAGLKDKH
jgi:uncharacterized protein